MSAASGRSPAERVVELREQIARHDYLYFVEGAPEISDRRYDALMHELRELERRQPELVTPDSPTQRVGEQPLEGFDHVEHRVPMLSIDNTYSVQELREFDERVARGLEHRDYEYVVDPKIDGVAASLRYERGKLVLAATRGDGRTGDDITQNIRTLRSVPLSLRGEGWPGVLEVRGEIYWPRSEFERVNREREAAGQPVFKNPRNGTTGTIKLLDSRVVAARGLRFECHGLGQIEPFPADVNTHAMLFERLRSWGLPTSRYARRCADIDAVAAFVEQWDARRGEIDYDTDGLVIKINQLELRDALGVTSKSPRWCIAFKFETEQAQSVLLSVDFQVGRLGTITPRANLEPVQLGGTTVSHATLHNFDQVRRLDLHIGDTVTVEKAGEIIPQVVAVDVSRRARGAKAIQPPGKCPECEQTLVQDEGGVALRCVNAECPAQLVERLRFFCGRNQMDIEGAGAVLVETLVARGFVKEFADLYRLHQRREELIPLERMGAKSVDNLLAGIEAGKKRPLSRVLAALNIRHIGANTAELLAEHFGAIDALQSAAAAALQEVEGIGPEVAASLRAWLDSVSGRRVIAELVEVGVNLTQPKRESTKSGVLNGKTVVITGTLARYGRKQAESLVKEYGGKASGSVSKNTDYLVAGDKAGSKLEKARKLGVTVLDEAGFERLLGLR